VLDEIRPDLSVRLLARLFPARLDRVRLGLDGREEEAGWFCDLLRAMGRLGIGVLCWNFMAGMGWTRTSVAVPARGGALVSEFDHAYTRDAPPLEAVGAVPAERLWDNLAWFLERVVPVAEAAGVRMALHPDDPPLSPMRGVARIQTTLDELERAVDLVPSPAHGLTLCQGNVALMTDDVPGAIRRFGARGKIHFAHVRDVRGTPQRFVETFHDEGPTDMLACLRAYREVGADVPMRVDHVATLAGDVNDAPGYSTLGVLFAVGYLTGMREAAYADPDRSTA
jgi:mannonate dehydratase